MKIYVTAISVLFAICCKSQNLSDTVLAVLKSENLISHVIHHPKFIEHNFLSEDRIDFGVMIYSGMVYTYRTSNGLEAKILSANIYTRNDSIFLVKIKAVNLNYKTGMKQDSVIYCRVDTAILSEYVAQHNNMYYSTWTVNDMVEKIGNFSYGGFCFYSEDFFPHLTDDAKKLAKLVKERSVDKLKDLASSFSKYERAFGSAGLFFLVLQGDRLNDELLDLVGINQESKLILHTCNNDQRQSMQEALDPFNLKGIYTLLRDSKLL